MIFISIIMILAVLYVFRLISPQEATEYPDIIRYSNQRYIYTETVKSMPIMFSKVRPASEEGYMVLSRRGTSVEEEVYIYEGYRKYRRYDVLKE